MNIPYFTRVQPSPDNTNGGMKMGWNTRTVFKP